jgi:NADH:ubiquinone reductase (H+-translocating)
MFQSSPTNRRPRVVIIGAGFGGLSAAKALARAPFDVTLIDPPQLSSVPATDLPSRNRGSVVRRHRFADPFDTFSPEERERGACQGLGRGPQFGHDGWAGYAPGLKTIADATYLRRRTLLAFEKAETDPDEERRRLLNFVVVGGGPTGVEMAGAIAELASRALASNFRNIDPRCARIILVEAAPRLLTPFDPPLSEAAKRSLEQLGVEVCLGAVVTDCDCGGVSIGSERIEARTIMWAAGVKASPAGDWLGAETDHVGRVKVDTDLSLPGHPDISVIGDVALVVGGDGKPLPGVAPVAK